MQAKKTHETITDEWMSPSIKNKNLKQTEIHS